MPEEADHAMHVRRLIVPPFMLLVAICAFSFVGMPRVSAQGSKSLFYTENLPTSFSSAEAAKSAGCDFAHVEGPAIDACLFASFGGNEMDIVIYEPSEGGSYRIGNRVVVTSWYWDGKLFFLNVSGTDWLVIETDGTHGTGIAQSILLIIAWDGSRFRTVATETLGYRCTPTDDMNYVLDVQHRFEETLGAPPDLHLDYELKSHEQTIGLWNDTLVWSARRFVFEHAGTLTVQSNQAVEQVRRSIGAVRDYFSNKPFELSSNGVTAAANNQQQQLGDSGLADILFPSPCNW